MRVSIAILFLIHLSAINVNAQKMCFGEDTTMLIAARTFLVTPSSEHLPAVEIRDLAAHFRLTSRFDWLTPGQSFPEGTMSFFIVPVCDPLNDSTCNYSMALFRQKTMPVLGSGTNPKGFFIGVDQSRALVSIPVNPAHFYSAQCAPLLRALASLLETSVWQNEKTWKEKFPKRYVGEHIQTLYFDTLDLSAVFDNDEQILKSVNPMARLAVFNDSTIAAMKSPGRAMAYRVPVFDREGHCTIHQYFSGPEGGIFYYETFPLPSGTEVRFGYGDLARFNRSTKPGK